MGRNENVVVDGDYLYSCTDNRNMRFRRRTCMGDGAQMNYWYVARPNELFLDIDNVSRSIAHTKARLQGAIEHGKLDVFTVAVHKSRSRNHLHAIITLNEPMYRAERAVWEIVLRGDIYRGCCNIMRILYAVPAPNVLISPYPAFQALKGSPRSYDYSCSCNGKHKAAVMLQCPVAKDLRGENRARGFFGKPSKNPCEVWK